MKINYKHKKIERYVQKKWKKNKPFKTKNNLKLKKFYCLSMIPYPSGNLHIGHVRNYTIGDIIARYKRLKKRNVLHPIGWDSFGLPAENAALKNNLNPYIWTIKNIKYMKKQLKNLGISYDWDKEITTCDPQYYKWEQWLFIKLFKKKLVYKKKSVVNWCPKDKTVLANEQVINKKCWRCNTTIKYKYISQWFIKTKKYAKKLLKDIKYLKKWPENVKNMQKKWIGKSKGTKITLKIKEFNYKIKIYTLKIKSILKTICISISIDNKILKKIIKKNTIIKKKLKKLTYYTKKKYYGFNTNINAINPINNKLIPIWVTNFTEEQYNTKEIFITNENKIQNKFINKYNLNKKIIINNNKNTKPNFKINIKKLLILKKKKIFQKKINYKIKDWVISRQRFWGVPIPIIKLNKSLIPIKYKELPVILPENTKNIKNNLKKNKKWKTYLIDNKYAIRETDTFDTFLESSWYYIRYTSINYKKSILHKKKANYWLPIDTYIGGIEHATMHLIYFRLIHKIIRDMNLIKFKEPAKELICQGMVLSDTFYYIKNNIKKWINFSVVKKIKKNDKFFYFFYLNNKKIELIHDGINKMSKSKNNGINPNKIIKKYGADTLRLFIIFSAPIEKNLYWIEDGIKGCYKFIKKLWKIIFNFKKLNIPQKKLKQKFKKKKKLQYLLNKTIYDVTKIIKKKKYLNTAISKIMEFIKYIKNYHIETKNEYITFKQSINNILIILYPFAPHISFYLWKKMNNKKNIDQINWPKISKKELKQKINIQIGIQINGKTKKTIIIKNTYKKKKIILKINKLNLLKNYLNNHTKINKIIYIKNRIINFIINKN